MSDPIPTKPNGPLVLTGRGGDSGGGSGHDSDEEARFGRAIERYCPVRESALTDLRDVVITTKMDIVKIQEQLTQAARLGAESQSHGSRITAIEMRGARSAGYAAGIALAVSLIIGGVGLLFEPKQPDISPITDRLERVFDEVMTVRAGLDAHLTNHPDTLLRQELERLRERVDALLGRAP